MRLRTKAEVKAAREKLGDPSVAELHGLIATHPEDVLVVAEGLCDDHWKVVDEHMKQYRVCRQIALVARTTKTANKEGITT